MEGRQGAAVALDDVMPSCAEEVLPITALLNDSRLACIGGFSTVHSEVQSTVNYMAHSHCPIKTIKPSPVWGMSLLSPSTLLLMISPITSPLLITGPSVSASSHPSDERIGSLS